MQQIIKGLVIHQRDMDDKDRLVTILTPDSGVMTAYVKGAKRARGSLSASTELLAYSTFTINDKNGASFIDKAENETVFFGLRQDLEKLALATYFCQLCRELVPEYEPSAFVFRLMLNALYLLEKGSYDMDLLKAVVELRLLTEEGYMPDLTACRSCGAKQSDAFYFSLSDGCIYCKDCRELTNESVVVSSPVLSCMNHILSSPMEKLFGFTLAENAAKDLAQICERYLLSQMERMVPALDFYKSMKLTNN